MRGLSFYSPCLAWCFCFKKTIMGGWVGSIIKLACQCAGFFSNSPWLCTVLTIVKLQYQYQQATSTCNIRIPLLNRLGRLKVVLPDGVVKWQRQLKLSQYLKMALNWLQRCNRTFQSWASSVSLHSPNHLWVFLLGRNNRLTKNFERLTLTKYIEKWYRSEVSFHRMPSRNGLQAPATC